MQLVSGGPAKVESGGGLSLISAGVTDVEGAQTTIKGGAVTICCPSR
jgi:hypothetical protein